MRFFTVWRITYLCWCHWRAAGYSGCGDLARSLLTSRTGYSQANWVRVCSAVAGIIGMFTASNYCVGIVILCSDDRYRLVNEYRMDSVCGVMDSAWVFWALWSALRRGDEFRIAGTASPLAGVLAYR